MGKFLEAGSCSLSESNTPPSLLKLHPNIESEEIGKNIHYALRLENTNGTINNGSSTTAFKCYLINILREKEYLWYPKSINCAIQLKNTNRTINNGFSTTELKGFYINTLTERNNSLLFNSKNYMLAREFVNRKNIS
jgi:hypothetical protein